VIEPLPPVAPVALPWDERQADPVAVLAAARADHGDTFVVESGADRYLFLFSPDSVRSFYALAEEDASKGIADWRMLRRKLPDEVFAGRRTLPHQLFGRHDVGTYLTHLDTALDRTIDEMGDDGEVDAFGLARRLAHRMGLASWGGPGAAEGERFDALVAALDVLDASDAFVRPDLMAAVAASDHADERAALARVTDLLVAVLADHDAGPGGDDPDDLFARIAGRWDDVDPAERAVGVAHDVVLVHLASMSNLFAALGWSLVDVVRRPDLLDRVRAGESGLAERCALESIRCAQRSIMLRHVLRPVEMAVDPTTTVRVEPGATLATLLPLTNASAAPGLDRWDPDRWIRRRLGPHDGLAATELVTTFGHGPHTCPAQPFSLAALTRTIGRLSATYDLALVGDPPEPLAAQIGGVARAAGPTPIHHRRR
jgi:cytochrome P450